MAMAVALMTAMSAFAQADKIVGVYSAQHEGRNSKIKITKVNDGYRAQIIWVDNLKKPDGTVRTDEKNPDPKKRSTPADQIVLIERVTYNAKKKQWGDGKIYEPTSGKVWTVTCSFEDDNTLKVRGSWGIFGKSVHWKKLE